MPIGDKPDKPDKPDKSDSAKTSTGPSVRSGEHGAGQKEGFSQAERACSKDSRRADDDKRGAREQLDFIGELLSRSGIEKRQSTAGDSPGGAFEQEKKNPTERCSDWSSIDCWSEKVGQVVDATKRVAEYRSGSQAMARNYVQMRVENTKGNDKYFHCKGNCEATSVGPGGEQAALSISEFREETVDRTLDKLRGKTRVQSLADSAADKEANLFGRTIGRERDATRCAPACYDRFRYRRER